MRKQVSKVPTQMETVVEEHDDHGSQSISVKGERHEAERESKDGLIEVQERDDSGIESNEPSHSKS